jgi:hypothetical protein
VRTISEHSEAGVAAYAGTAASAILHAESTSSIDATPTSASFSPVALSVESLVPPRPVTQRFELNLPSHTDGVINSGFVVITILFRALAK